MGNLSWSSVSAGAVSRELWGDLRKPKCLWPPVASVQNAVWWCSRMEDETREC